MRLWIGLLGALACAMFSSHRSSLSVAIVQMAKYNSSNIVHDENSGQCFKRSANHTEEQPIIRGEFDWNESMQGIILGASFYMYLVTPTISGRITERFGAKWLTFVTVVAPGAILSLLPVAAYYSVNLMIALLFIQGLFHGCVFAALFSLYANWFTAPERTFAIAGLAAGSNFGNLVTFPVAGYLCEHGFAGGWPSVFYVVSLAHIPWIILWIIFVEDTPLKSNTSGFIKCSDKELKYIQININSFGAPKRSSSAPWAKIFTSKCVWASIISKCCAGWGYYLLQSKLPSYLDKVFGISLFHNGLYNAGTSLATGVTMVLGGPLSAFVIRKTSHRVSKTTIRKIFQSIALLGPALCLGLITIMECEADAVVALLITAPFLYGFLTGGEFSIISEFAPDFSGTIFGIAATLSAWPAFVAPYVVGVMLGDSPGERSRWNEVFYITIALYIIGTLVFIFCASAEPQEWGLIKKDDQNGDENINKSESKQNIINDKNYESIK